MTTSGWERTPWVGRVVARGPRGIDQVRERLDRLDSRSVDGIKVRRRRRDGVTVWRRSFEREVLLPAVRGRIVDGGAHVEIRAIVRPVWTAWFFASYGVIVSASSVAAAVQDRSPLPLLAVVAVAAIVAVVGRRAGRRYRADVEATERVLCSIVAGDVVERRSWPTLRRSEPRPSHP